MGLKHRAVKAMREQDERRWLRGQVQVVGYTYCGVARGAAGGGESASPAVPLRARLSWSRTATALVRPQTAPRVEDLRAAGLIRQSSRHAGCWLHVRHHLDGWQSRNLPETVPSVRKPESVLGDCLASRGQQAPAPLPTLRGLLLLQPPLQRRTPNRTPPLTDLHR